jgi:diacylglycerol kinase family enzyme
MVTSPYAVPDDGILDVIFASLGGTIDLFRKIGSYTNGKFEKYEKAFSRKQGRTLEVYSELPLCVELDGESFFAKEIKLSLIPGGIKFFAPENLNFADYSYRAYHKKKGEKK